MEKRVKNLKALILIFALAMSGSTSDIMAQDGTWVAPANADNMSNPYTDSADAMKAGKKLYNQNCSICHGAKGKGDGMAGMALKPRPADFTKEIVKEQSDGAIYWKITEGKAPMASYKTVFTEEQRWQLVNYIRTL
jgi:mono/diheme cytochrome c family protein